MEQAELFSRFGAALAIGILIGLQREYALGEPDKELTAGIRTFALISLSGSLGALASDLLNSPWPFIAVLLVVGAFITTAYFIGTARGEIGLTTEVAAMMTVLVGALCYWGFLLLAAAIGVATTVLLSLKVEMHEFVRHITREDVYATLKFAVITAIVLPILPDRDFGPTPLDVLNPFNIWLMVVFISGISFLGYILIKLIGPQPGIGLTGFLGGLVSSTAVTLSFTQRSRVQADLARPLALAINISWTTMFFRVLVVVAALNVALLGVLWLPMIAAAAIGLAYCGYLYVTQRTDEKGDVAFENPFELRPALQFGLLYVIILLASTAAQVYLGDTGVYISSIAAGLADLNAITLSMAELSRGAGLDLVIAARAIVLAAVANTAVKGGIVMAGGAPALRRAVLPGFVLMLVTAVGIVFLLV